MSEHRGLDHKGIERDCIQEWHFCGARDGVDDYALFLERKRMLDDPSGFDMPDDRINPQLFGFQRDIVRWALRRGRAAIFADCGLGKTPMQLEWAKHVHERTGRDVLIFAPLAVAEQTSREGEKFGIDVTHCRSQDDVRAGVNIANYERLHLFSPAFFEGLVLDESSILKGFDGVTRRAITEFGSGIPFRLACTATPAPNDLIELTNHAEFLNVMSGKEIIALFFTQDGNTTHAWRLKGHARQDFWRWMASWSVALRKPSDLGYQDEGFILPPLRMHQTTVGAAAQSHMLFPVEALTMQERRDARRESIDDRVTAAAKLVNDTPGPWVVWCDLNAESAALHKAIPGSVEVKGSDPTDHKERAMRDFALGKVRVIVTKPTIAGFGMNWQHCAQMAFVGLSDSFEQMYQATRRCWRFGQTRPVDVHVITAETEGAVVKNIERKERQAADMMANIVQHMAGLSLGKQERNEMAYETEKREGDGWTMYLGDAVEMIDEIADESVGLSVFSPPFPGMYAYTNSPHDMGNVRDNAEMIEQFRFLIPGLLRVTMPGRTCAIHLTQSVAFKGVDGYIGIKDFRGEVIRAMEDAGWIYYGEVCIDKDPQVKAIRTKDQGLLFKSLASDSARMHMALADYLLQFRKPGDNPSPIPAGLSARYGNTTGWITADEWIEWAAPVWYRQTEHYPGGIRETDVLNVAQARQGDDERHLCPLQLGVIERAVKLWSAPDDLVLSPFAGIGSEGYESLRHGRRFVGIELKREYYEWACHNLAGARQQATML